jgi:hypothetical protein
MTRAPCRVLRGVGYRPITSVSGHGSAAGAGRSRPPGSRHASGAPRPTHSHEAPGTDRRSWCRRPCHRTELGRTPLTPGPVVDERLPPAGPVSTVERRVPQLPKTAWRPRRVPDLGQCRVRVGPRELGPTGPQLHPYPAPRRPPEPGRRHLSPGDLWRALDGEYPRTAILVRRHYDVITLTDQYGDTFAYPAAAAVPTAVPDALGSAGGGRAASPPGSRTPRSVLRVAGK